jgi:hypothetical protein
MNQINELINSIKRNHGLEHATIHLLSKKFPERSFVGHSNTGGFWIKGNVSLDEFTETMNEALHRLKSGEHSLSVHPNCGTNLLASGFAAALGSWIAVIGVGKKTKDKIERFPMMIVLSVIGLMVSIPLGPYLQRKYTTTGEMGNLEVLEIKENLFAGKISHIVKTVVKND